MNAVTRTSAGGATKLLTRDHLSVTTGSIVSKPLFACEKKTVLAHEARVPAETELRNISIHQVRETARGEA